MRLSRFIIAALIAAIGIFPISGVMPAAAGMDHHAHVAPMTHDHAAAAEHRHDDVSRDAASHDGDGSACCGSIACHAFSVSAAPDLSVPIAYAAKAIRFQDQRTPGALSVSIERPPRTL